MLDQSYYDKADEIVASHGAYQESLIPIIQDCLLYTSPSPRDA